MSLAASNAALPEKKVPLEAKVPLSNGVASVSPEIIAMLLISVHRHSAATFTATVSNPVPKSAPPMSNVNVPSPSILSTALAESRPGIPEPCCTITTPWPIFTSGSSLSPFRPQLISSAPFFNAGPKPQLATRSGLPSRPSPRHLRISSMTPSRTLFFSINSSGSIPSFAANSAIAIWRA